MINKLSEKLNTEVALFAVVGVINTAIDFAILNLLMQAFGIAEIPANVISVSVAMTFSFIANKRVVFSSEDGETKKTRRQLLLFVGVTAISVYVVQNIIIYILTDLWGAPLSALYDVIPVFTENVFVTNVAKIVATGASLVWNFYFYKNLVFKDEKLTEKSN